ncbi:hypothetical protein [Plantactinospora sp. CA-290183]|uniref:hypothetical protein n=1 Tax=Plantactinospora sp. CA-290183 TaxID=3240006 RepID=UPI003D8BACD2
MTSETTPAQQSPAESAPVEPVPAQAAPVAAPVPVAVVPAQASPPPGENQPHPTKVRIETPGATIDIEANEPLAEVVATALRVFHEAGGWPQVNRGSAGFAQLERRDTHPVQPSSMPYGPGAYPIQTP